GRFEVAVNARAAGPRLGKDVQKVIKAVKAGDWSRTPEGKVVAAGIELLPEEFTERLVSTDTGASTALPNGAGLVSLVTEVTTGCKLVGAGSERLPEELAERLVSTETGASTALPKGAGLVSLETEVTPELAAEGLARDVVRVIQQARREADFAVSDRITVTIS